MDIYSTVNTRSTPQSERADPRQVKNAAGGYVFALDDEDRLRRFLTLGSEGGTYYAGAKDLTLDNAAVVMRMAKTQPVKMVEIIKEISVAGRAPKANPALFALAVVAAIADEEGKRAAQEAIPDVVRTGTHLFLFVGYSKQFRGMGRSLRRSIANWYLDKSVEDLAYQMVKYRQREGWTHRDLLRQSHPRTTEPDRHALFDWGVGRPATIHSPDLVQNFAVLQREDLTLEQALGIVQGERAISWEMVPDRFINEPSVWEALLAHGMPQTALMRQLPRLTRLGLTKGETGKVIVAQIQDGERLKRARVHPINVLVAQRTYASGRSARGEGIWTPTRQVVDALDAAFYAAFGAVEPTGKRTMLALDVSGSMGMASISNMPLTPREASAALALVTASVEEDYEIVGFTGDPHRSYGGWYSNVGTGKEALTPLSLSPRQRLDDAIRSISDLPMGPTDCAQPMLYALKHGLEIDTFVTFTDNDTWAGPVHTHQALRQYRDKTGIAARNIVVGMTATGLTINDPSDPLGLDIAGFDSAVPGLISDFARGAV